MSCDRIHQKNCTFSFCYVAGSCRHLSLVKSYSTTDKMYKNKGISMYKTKGSGAEAPIHKEPPGAGPYS